jgi:hypothetical protein
MNNVTHYRTLSSHNAQELTLLLQEAFREGWHLFGIPTTQRTFDNLTGVLTVTLTQALVKYEENNLKSAVQ